MTTQPNKYIVDTLIESLRVVTNKLTIADKAYDDYLAQRDKLRASLDANDALRTDLALKRDALTDHIALLSPPMSDEEIAALGTTPDVVQP